MGSKFGLVARCGRDWQAQGTGWEAHTLTPDAARDCARAYLRFLRDAYGRGSHTGLAGLDIGAGAGYLAAALASEDGIRMTASEWNEDGLSLLKRENPALEGRLIDLTAFDDKNTWDIVVCRELYPFTRVNAFSDQHDAICRIVDSLKQGGVFLLVGSDINAPHCADYRLLVKTFRGDSRLRHVSEPYLEAVLRRSRWFSFGGRLAYLLATQVAEAATWLIRRRKRWAAIRVIAFIKK